MPNWVKNIVHVSGPEEDIAKALDLMRDKNAEGDIDFNNVFPLPKRLKIVSGGYDRYYVALYLRTLDMSEILRLEKELHEHKLGFYGTYSRKYADSFAMGKDCVPIPEDKLTWMKDHIDKDYENIPHASMEDVGKAYIDNILEYGADTWYEWCIDNWGTKWNACEAKIGDDYLEFETAWDAPFPITEELSRRFPELTFSHEWADENLGYNCGKVEFKGGESIAEYEFESDDESHEFACMMWGYGPDDMEDEE